MKLALFLAALTAAAPAIAAPFTVEETGRGYNHLADAVRAIGSGDGTITIAPGIYRECAVQESGRVAYRAAQPGSAVFDGVLCEDKAALVLRGRDAVVDGLAFQNMASIYSGNGAGIRFERGNLTIQNAFFRNSQQGILTADSAASALRIDKTSFSGLGTCSFSAGCAHSAYVGHIGSLTVTRSRFERGTGGHYLKSRAARVEVTDSSFDDSKGRWSNYMIDLPSGATGLIARNTFLQGTDHENHSALIAVAAEERANSSAGLTVRDNKATLAPAVDWNTVFVADWSHQPLKLGPNQLGARIKPFETR